MTADGTSLISSILYFLTNTKDGKGRQREESMQRKNMYNKRFSVFLIQENWKEPPEENHGQGYGISLILYYFGYLKCQDRLLIELGLIKNCFTITFILLSKLSKLMKDHSYWGEDFSITEKTKKCWYRILFPFSPIDSRETEKLQNKVMYNVSNRGHILFLSIFLHGLSCWYSRCDFE